MEIYDFDDFFQVCRPIDIKFNELKSKIIVKSDVPSNQHRMISH